MGKTIIVLFFTAIAGFAQKGIEIPAIIDSTAFVKHNGYTLEYFEPYEQARWVAYELDRSKASVTVTRKDAFRADPAVKTGSASLDDYKGSGYDRGHLFPAADAWDSITMSESFYLSNISPQEHAFNAGIWAKLEDQVRDWAIKFDTIYVVTGPILRDHLPTIGPDNVAIPEYYYKAILCLTSKDTMAIGLILKGENTAGSLSIYAITIDSLESLSDIDFYPALNDDLEGAIERHIEPTKWFSTTEVQEIKTGPAKKRSPKRHSSYDLNGRQIPKKHTLKSTIRIKG